MRATSPPGSTIAARLVAVQATIEQFWANGVTGTMVTLSGCMGPGASEERRPSYSEPVVLREGFQRRLGPRAEMLDDFGCRKRAEPRTVAMILAAGEAGEEPGSEQIARAGRVHQPVDRRRGDGLVAFPRNHHTTLLAARHHGELHVTAQRRERGIEIGGLIKTLQFALIGKHQVDRAGAHQIEEFIAIAPDTESIRQRQRDL